MTANLRIGLVRLDLISGDNIFKDPFKFRCIYENVEHHWAPIREHVHVVIRVLYPTEIAGDVLEDGQALFIYGPTDAVRCF